MLPDSAIEQALWELKIKYKKRLFDPIVTLWAFLSQVIDTDKSCHNAVSKIIAHLAESEVEIPSTDTSAYADMFAIKKLDCDAVFRKHQSRTTTMRKGKIVGDCDKLVTWYKPKTCPKGLSKDEFDALPQTLTVREIYYYIVIPL